MTTWFIWAQFRWNWTNLKIWPLYKRSMTFSCFGLYLENEASYGFHVIDFFAPYDPRKNLICITTRLNHFHYSTNLEDGRTLTPLTTPPCSWLWMVSTLGMLLIVYRIHPYRTRFYILIMQLALKYGVCPLGKTCWSGSGYETLCPVLWMMWVEFADFITDPSRNACVQTW